MQARDLVQQQFGGLSSAALQVVVRADGGVATGRGAEVVREATALLRADDRLSTIVPPTPGVSVSQDGRTGVVQAGAATTNMNEMVRAADDLKEPLRELGGDGVTVALTGSSGLWSDFNEANLEAMLKSELFSWPVTLTIMVLAFGLARRRRAAADAHDPRAGLGRRDAVPRSRRSPTSASGR